MFNNVPYFYSQVYTDHCTLTSLQYRRGGMQRTNQELVQKMDAESSCQRVSANHRNKLSNFNNIEMIYFASSSEWCIVCVCLTSSSACLITILLYLLRGRVGKRDSSPHLKRKFI